MSYTYDPVYNRVATMTDGIGATNYTYNPITGSPTLGAGRLASVDGALGNDTITYGYDELGRVTNRSIDGANNATTTAFDSLGRVAGATNPLGAFGYFYVNTTGRLDHATYPNGQVTQFAYYGNTGDQRLQQIKHLDPSSAMLSQHDYGYDAAGEITT